MSEKESSTLLKSYGVPMVDAIAVSTVDQAVKAASEIGFPVVVKGYGPSLIHKTERKLVYLNLYDRRSVKKAAVSIADSAGSELEGLLVQPQVEGQREFLAGLFRDPQFGPVIIFGVGGIFAEALSDSSLRLAPLTEKDAAEMIHTIQARSLLDQFRGEAPVSRAQLIDVIMSLSRLATDRPEISEVDINPLRVAPAGQVTALDALVIQEPLPEATEYLPAIPTDALKHFFHPRSIAFVGASAQIGKWGHILFTLTVSGGFEGDIYLVNSKGGTIAGKNVYRAVNEIPGEVDLAVVTIPAAKVGELIFQFKEKNIRNMLLVTSGFSETGESGRDLEKKLADSARNAGIRIVGPNTMGICNPHIHLYCTGSHVRPIPGSTAVVAQSGNMGTQLLAFAEQQGIGIRAFCGSGNEAMIAIEDYLDAFEDDPITRTVMLYVESVKNGRRFFESARRVGKQKPIILLKGGRSQAGNRAARSHTGALTSDTKVFDAVCRQAGIVKVERPMDLLDLAAAFSSLPLPGGNRAAIMTLGGGWGVVTADLCSDYGLEVPGLPQPLVEKFDALLPAYWSRANPVDIVGELDNAIPMTVIEELLKWDGCDAVINLGILGRRILLERLADSVLKADPSYSPEFLEAAGRSFVEFEKKYIAHIVKLMGQYNKPVYGVSMLTDQKDQTVYRVSGNPFKGVFYASPERAVKAFAKMVEYNRFLSNS